MEETCDDWDVRRDAERVIKALKDKADPNKKFAHRRKQMQEIYLVARTTGISLKLPDLVHLWRKLHQSSYEVHLLERKREALLAIQRNASKRIRAVEDQIRKLRGE